VESHLSLMIQFILLQAQGMAERDIIKNAGNQNIISTGIKNEKAVKSSTANSFGSFLCLQDFVSFLCC